MSGTEVRAEVVLCPDEQLQGEEPQRSWPRLAGAGVEIVKRATPAVTDETGADGQVRFRELEAGTYDLTVTPGAELHRWTLDPPNPVKVDTRRTKALQKIKLIPPADHRLLPLLLCGEGPGGKLIPLKGAQVDISGAGGYIARDDGHVYALVPHDPAGHRVTVEVTFHNVQVDGRDFEPPDKTVTFDLPEPGDTQVETPTFVYSPKAKAARPVRGIFIKPTMKPPSGKPVPLSASVVTVEQHSGTPRPAPQSKALRNGEETVSFPNLDPGVYLITVHPPGTFDGWQIKAEPQSIGPRYLNATEHFEREVEFDFEAEKLTCVLQTPGDRPLDGDVELEVYGRDGSDMAMARAGKFSTDVPSNSPLRIRLAPGQPAPTIGGVPLEMVMPDQDVEPSPGPATVALRYQHQVTGRAVDESHTPMPGAVILLYDGNRQVASAVADNDGIFILGAKAAGNYSLAIQTEGGTPVTQQPVSVHSVTDVDELMYRPWPPSSGPARAQDSDDQGPDRLTREAFTDLAAYPVLTEEVSTTGVPAPVAGGTGGGAGAGYGQVVDQAMRDVLGWRPGADVSGFQAALTGAFQLRELEGHTEWTWQQRGYAVQADMGALTGAQASIYARAKSALDQILPLLAGLTPLNPALFPPQDLEAIRTVITTELRELVTELALQGGPRIQRVDQFFHLLTGARTGSKNLNPDLVQGNLGTLRDRFGLTVDEIDTVDEERIVTNFRIVVEQVLSLQASWSTDRGLLAPLDPRASFGTILIWLSRSLEAVCESVGDLNFALDSVFVDAAQRQVLELNFPDEETLLLSDLLDWVDRASRDEGPRIIQDAGKDGVFAFAPVLRRLHDLVRETQHAARHDRGLPHGMRTPRVDRALQVLVAQLGDATDLAGAVRRDAPPQIEETMVSIPGTSTPVDLAHVPRKQPSIQVDILGANFRPNASAVLIAQDREDLPELHTWSIMVTPPGAVTTTFRNPATVRHGAGVTWLVAVTNEDGTHSNQFPI